jgi:hypothetical protein
MTDIVERLRSRRVDVSERDIADAADEIERLRALNTQLGEALSKQHLRAIENEETRAELQANNERLFNSLRAIVEIYAGMDGVPIAETACEGYLLRIIRQMKYAAIDAANGEK